MPTVFAFYIARKTLSDKLICAATGYPESHVELLLIPEIKRSNLCIGASKRDGKRVRKKVITWKPGHWTFVTLPALSSGVSLKRAYKHLGKPYDTLGAALSVSPLSLPREDIWFCSAFGAEIVDLRDPHRHTPGKFKRALLDMGGVETTLGDQNETQTNMSRSKDIGA